MIIKYVENQSNNNLVWIDRKEIELYTTYSFYIGNIQKNINGFYALGIFEEKTFSTFEDAKNFIIKQYEKEIN